jgi:hypothetical protein
MPSSNTVTTPQIVRMMKRGENGSISVSMEFLGSNLIGSAFPACSVALGPGQRPDGDTISQQPPHDINSISTAPVGRMTAELLPEIIQSSGKQSIHAERRFCSAT